MAIPFLRVIRGLGKRQPFHTTGRPHLMLRGISQSVFLNNWGEPDAQISLKRLATLNGRRALYLSVNSEDDADHSVWIYKNRDRVLFFTKKKLIIHSKWSGFEEFPNRLRGKNSVNATLLASAFLGKSLAFVA